MRTTYRPLSLLILLCGFALPGRAADIEPRRWTPLPVGTHILGAGVTYLDGDITVDPVLKLEQVTVEMKSVGLSYLYAFDLLGMSSRLDLLLPRTHAKWRGILDGERATAVRVGLSDPRIRLSVNFFGAPALKPKQYMAYRAANPVNTVVGAALAVTVPLGEYKENKLLNLGGNRYVIRPQLGVVHSRGRWSYELTGSTFFYTDNHDFFGDSKREQDPLYAIQSHVTYTSPMHWWASAGAAYGWAGESKVDGVSKGDEKGDLLYGVSAGYSLAPISSIKLAYIRSETQENTGVDSHRFILAISGSF